MKLLGGILFLLLFSVSVLAKAETDVLRFGEKHWPQKLLMVPGLNFNPQRFYEIKDELVSRNVEVHLLHLKFTHEKDRLWEDGELAEHWLNQFASAVSRLSKESEALGGSYRVLAYSLGGLVTETYLQTLDEKPKHLDRLIYLAPALSVKWHLRFFMNSARVLEESIRIPSWNLEDYQTRSYTYAGEYEALLDILDKLDRAKKKQLELETYLFMSAKDELLSFENVVEFLQELRPILQINSIKPRKEKTIGKFHLIVDSKSLTPEDYQNLVTSLIY